MNYVRLDKRRNEYGEFKVKVCVNGKYDETKSYYTSDWDDAIGTFYMVCRELGFINYEFKKNVFIGRA